MLSCQRPLKPLLNHRFHPAPRSQSREQQNRSRGRHCAGCHPQRDTDHQPQVRRRTPSVRFRVSARSHICEHSPPSLHASLASKASTSPTLVSESSSQLLHRLPHSLAMLLSIVRRVDRGHVLLSDGWFSAPVYPPHPLATSPSQLAAQRPRRPD